MLFFSDDCSQATINMFYDILIPRLTYAQYHCQCRWLSKQTTVMEAGLNSYTAVDSPKTHVCPLLFAILLKYHISKSGFYTTWLQHLLTTTILCVIAKEICKFSYNIHCALPCHYHLLDTPKYRVTIFRNQDTWEMLRFLRKLLSKTTDLKPAKTFDFSRLEAGSRVFGLKLSFFLFAVG